MSEQFVLTLSENGFVLPRENGEDWVLRRGYGYSPVQSVVAATAACGGYVYREILKNSKVDATILDVTASYETDGTPVNAIASIDLVFKVQLTNANDQGKAQTALKLVSKYCPVMQSLNPNIKVNESVDFVD